MFKILRWVSPSGKRCEAMLEESKTLPMVKLLQEKGVQVQVCDDTLTVTV